VARLPDRGPARRRLDDLGHIRPRNGTVAPFTEVINDDSAVSLGHPFLWGYRIWGEERYLKATCDLADFYARAQFAEGVGRTRSRWGGGNVTPVWQIANFEEWVQSNGIRQLRQLTNSPASEVQGGCGEGRRDHPQRSGRSRLVAVGSGRRPGGWTRRLHEGPKPQRLGAETRAWATAWCCTA